MYSLSVWYNDVCKRHIQLDNWTQGDVITPLSVWLPGLFNPKAFLTAVNQTYARANKLPLDVMRSMTEVRLCVCVKPNKRMRSCAVCMCVDAP